MNKYLKSASDRFEKIKDKDYLINPISREDCEIITEIRQIFKKAGLDSVLAILDDYKYRKDSEIVDDLLQWNIDNPLVKKDSKGEIVKEDFPQPRLVVVGDFNIPEYNIRGFRRVERWNKEIEDYEYCVMINPLPDVGVDLKKVPPFANQIVFVGDEENCNRILCKMRQFYEDSGSEIVDFNYEGDG